MILPWLTRLQLWERSESPQAERSGHRRILPSLVILFYTSIRSKLHLKTNWVGHSPTGRLEKYAQPPNVLEATKAPTRVARTIVVEALHHFRGSLISGCSTLEVSRQVSTASRALVLLATVMYASEVSKSTSQWTASESA